MIDKAIFGRAWLIAAMVLSGCATTPQPVAHDSADRAFLVLADIAQRPTQVGDADMKRFADTLDEGKDSKDPCLLWKNLMVLTASTQVLLVPLLKTQESDLKAAKAAARAQLTELSSSSSPDSSCGTDRAFPKVQFND